MGFKSKYFLLSKTLACGTQATISSTYQKNKKAEVPNNLINGQDIGKLLMFYDDLLARGEKIVFVARFIFCCYCIKVDNFLTEKGEEPVFYEEAKAIMKMLYEESGLVYDMNVLKKVILSNKDIDLKVAQWENNKFVIEKMKQIFESVNNSYNENVISIGNVSDNSLKIDVVDDIAKEQTFLFKKAMLEKEKVKREQFLSGKKMRFLRRFIRGAKPFLLNFKPVRGFLIF